MTFLHCLAAKMANYAFARGFRVFKVFRVFRVFRDFKDFRDFWDFLDFKDLRLLTRRQIARGLLRLRALCLWWSVVAGCDLVSAGRHAEIF